jgi:hypothetical protein
MSLSNIVQTRQSILPRHVFLDLLGQDVAACEKNTGGGGGGGMPLDRNCRENVKHGKVA